jgi:hypothetical protein
MLHDFSSLEERATPIGGSKQRLRMRTPQREKDDCEGICIAKRFAMKQKRNRSRPALPLQERLKQIATRAREQADGLPPGEERDVLIRVATRNEAAAVIDRWLSSPGLRSPK